MVVLGNGMRYGMRLFAEALLGSFGATMMVLSIRYTEEVGLPCSFTISIGQAPTHGHSFSSLLEKVDAELYYAKSEQSYGKIRRLDHAVSSPGST